MNEAISVMTDFGELVASPFAGGISVDINLPDGKGSGQLAFIEATPAELQDDYPTPVHVFTYDGRDSEPVHRTDVHLEGEGMTLDPVKGLAADNGVGGAYKQLDSDFIDTFCNWDEEFGFIKRSDPEIPGMPASFNYVLLALDSNGWHFGESSASVFDLPIEYLDSSLDIFDCSSISEFALHASEVNEPDFQEWLCSMHLRNEVEDRFLRETPRDCTQSTDEAFRLLSDKVGFKVEPENSPELYDLFFRTSAESDPDSKQVAQYIIEHADIFQRRLDAGSSHNPADVAKAASLAAGRSVGSGTDEAEGIKH